MAASSRPGIPRESGDDPSRVATNAATGQVFPARAGMIPSSARPPVADAGIPRESGDDPSARGQRWTPMQYSPRERG